MNGFSEQLAQMMVKEHNDKIQRTYEEQILVRIARQKQMDNFRQWLRDMIQRVRRGTALPLSEVVETSENGLYMSEKYDLSPEELNYKEAKRLLYERIANGTAMAEIESRDRRLWQEKA